MLVPTKPDFHMNKSEHKISSKPSTVNMQIRSNVTDFLDLSLSNFSKMLANQLTTLSSPDTQNTNLKIEDVFKTGGTKEEVLKVVR